MGHDPRATRILAVDAGHPAQRPSAPENDPAADIATSFEPPLWVRVTRLDGNDARELGVGRLLDALVVGESFRVSTQGGYALVTTPITRLDVIDAETVEAATEHACYRLQRTLSPEADPRGLAALGPGRHPTSQAEGRGNTAPLASTPVPGPGPFVRGARVRVVRLGSADPDDLSRTLGRGDLLDPIRVGAPLRFSLLGGAEVETSPVRGIDPDRPAGPGVLIVRTRNTSYRLELLDSSDEKPEDPE